MPDIVEEVKEFAEKVEHEVHELVEKAEESLGFETSEEKAAKEDAAVTATEAPPVAETPAAPAEAPQDTVTDAQLAATAAPPAPVTEAATVTTTESVAI